MDISSVCRTCMTTQYLNPIFNNLGAPERFSTAVYITTGLKVELNDGLPQYMCTKCMKFLNSSLKFRKQCKESHSKLIQLKNRNEHSWVDFKDIPNTDLFKNEFKDETDLFKIEKSPESDEDEKPLMSLLKNNVKIEMEHVSDREAEQDILIDELKIEEVEINPDFNLNKIDNENSLFVTHANRVTCKLCQKDLSIRSVDMHMAVKHPGADDRKVKCDLCVTYVLKHNLNRHKTLTHGRGSFMCGHCKTDFTNKESLVEHSTTCAAKKRIRTPSKASKELTKCDICLKVMQKASLRMHKKIKHAGMGPVCEHCGNRFGNKSRLKDHLRAKHGYEKFKCSTCEFQSANSVAMGNHERRHRGEKPFVCEACGAKFHAAYLLRQHKQSHRIDRPVKCDECPATFKTNNSLHMHRAACHGPARRRCAECPRAYRCRHYVARQRRLAPRPPDHIPTHPAS